MNKSINLTAPAEWVRGNLLMSIFGITENQARSYRREGHWKEGVHYRQDPTRRYVYNTRHINQWLGS